MGRSVTYALLLIVVITTTIWGFNNYLVQVLSTQIKDILGITSAVIAGLAGLNEITELIIKFSRLSIDKPPKVTPAEEKRSRNYLLNKMDKYWIKGVFENSLFGAVLIELGIQYNPEAVEYPVKLLVENESKIDKLVDPEIPLIDIYNQANNELLILGEPGSGKTTMMLALAKELLQIASKDKDYPIPVILNLSSWDVSQEPLSDWVVNELTNYYRIRKEVAIQWVETGALTLMLDGLDEVKKEDRDKCVTRTNEHLNRYGATSIVICSRQFEYQTLRKRLQLDTALRIQPLSEEQIYEFLRKTSNEFRAVQNMIEEDKIFLELAQFPLMLNIMLLAYQGLSNDDLKGLLTIETRRKHIFDSYVKRMLTRNLQGDSYNPDMAIKWLSWLAKNMDKDSVTIFQIDQIQPRWVSHLVHDKMFYVLEVIVNALISGCVIFMFSSLIIGLAFSFPINIWIGTILGFFYFCISLVELLAFDPSMNLKRSYSDLQSARSSLISSVLVGGVLGISYCFLLLMRANLINSLLIPLAIMLLSIFLLGRSWITLIVKLTTTKYILYVNGLLPLNIVRFLNFATDAILLRKVGGGYIFIHRLLLEYFSNLSVKGT